MRNVTTVSNSPRISLKEFREKLHYTFAGIAIDGFNGMHGLSAVISKSSLVPRANLTAV